jgi:hypothetical protein
MPRRDDDYDDSDLEDDDYDDRPRRRRPPPDLGDDAGMRLLLPVGRSPWAIAAGYLGLFSVLCLPAPFALFCGVMAVRQIRRDPKAHGMGRAVFGIVMGGLFTALPLALFLYGTFVKK